MGVLLTPILKKEETSFKALYGKSFAVDASIELHQFLALIRRRDGTLLTDSSGNVTSHLIGLLTRTSTLITEYNLRPVFVFDGLPSPLKRATIEARRRVQQKAQSDYVQAIAAKDYSKAWSKVVMTGRVTGSVLADAKKLLSFMGIPWLEALEDGEAQASYMAAKGDVWAVGSKDYDCLLFGSPILARYLTLTGKEYLPAQKTSRPLIPELINLADNLATLRISREQLVDLALLVGTDFNDGVKGIGPKKALALVTKYGAADSLPDDIRKQLPEDLDGIRKIFLHPRVLDNYTLTKSRPDPRGLTEFLVKERGFERDRVQKVADRLVRAFDRADSQLGQWLS